MGEGRATDRGVSSRAKSATSRGVSSRGKGHKDYVNGLNNLRQLITDLECNLDKVKRMYFCCKKNGEQQYEEYLNECNRKFLMCTAALGKTRIIQEWDSELKIQAFLSRFKDSDMDKEAVVFLAEYQTHLKEALDSVQEIKCRFTDTCLRRLKASCLSYRENVGVTNQLARIYEEEVNKYRSQISETLRKFDQLSKSYSAGIKQDLFTSTHFTNKILGSCDLKAYPVLRLIPDLMDKLVNLCSKSRQWVDKDETYVHNISDVIREKRKQTLRKEQDLRNQRQKQNRLLQSVDETYHMFQDNKAKLAKIESELQTLEQTVNAYNEDRAAKLQEVKQKEGMVGFLDIGISQTKKNYTLQLKRSRLLRQVRELEDSLRTIENELSELETQIRVKKGEKQQLTETNRDSNVAHKSLKNDLEKFNKVVENLQKEVSELTGSLLHLETLQNVKTSPEKVDDLFDKPVNVKLAPSLKEKISLRKKALTART